MSASRELEIGLTLDLATILLDTASQEGLSPETILAAAWVLLVSRYTGEDAVSLSLSAPPIHMPGQVRVRDWLRTLPDFADAVVCEMSGPQPLVKIRHDAAIFNDDALPRIPYYFMRLVGEIHSRLNDSVASIEMLPEDDKRRLLVDWNQTTASYPEHDCVHEQFEAQAAETPESVALVFQDQSFTYRELNAKANQLARRLVKLGVGPETLVGISLDRSLEMVVALLAILKSGGAYVPLDPAYPPARLKQVLTDAQPHVVLTQDRLAAQLRGEARLLCVDNEWTDITDDNLEPIGRRATSENLVYVIYTSGSTGKPKGVMIEHRNVISFFTAMDLAMGDRAPGIWLAVTSISFDISVLELFWTLTRGFKVVLQGDDGPRSTGDEYSIAKNIRTHRVTHLQCTPSLARMLMSDRESVQALSGLQKLLLGGEALPTSLAEQVRQVIPHVFNMYGPTETTIWSTIHVVKGPANVIPIGRPIANTQTYILDHRQRPVPAGATGELYIAGAGVARGYLNHPDLTAERFVQNPFNNDPTARMYKTGDVARFLPDGAIEFLGRSDFQVKIRGYRIELGEIETVLERSPGIRQAVVAAREDKPGDKRLVAYVVPDPATPPNSSRLRKYLQKNLPEYMQPAAFVTLQAMPLTANGKIDRMALPPPEGREIPVESAYRPSAPSLEEKIVNIWKDVLNVEQVSIHDNYFDLGAHSLLVADVHVKLQELVGIEIPLVTMFRYPTIRALADHLGENYGGSPDLNRSAARANARRESVRWRTIRQ